MKTSAALRLGAAVVLLAVLLQGGSVLAAPGVFSLDSLRLGSSSGPETYVYTAGDRVVPVGGADAGTFYRFVVTDSAGTVRNAAACLSASGFESADNSYLVRSSDPVSSAGSWTYRLNQYANATCSGSVAKTAAKLFYVAAATSYANSDLTTPKAVFPSAATAYVVVAGLKPSVKDWSATWVLPSGATACANTAGGDRPDAGSSGRLPSSGFLQYRPNPNSTGTTANREGNYETQPCPAFGPANDGRWRLRLEKNATTFVTVDAFTVDATAPPAPQIASGPPNPSSSTQASFTFSDAEPGVSFFCRLDGAAFTQCSSPAAYTSLGEGGHTFEVKARDAAGNDSAAAAYTWLVKSLPPPPPSIGSGPADPTSSTDASFSFSDAEPGVTFLCSLDGSGFAPCVSPSGYTALADAAHVFEVKANDAAGNQSAPTAFSWTVDTVAPAAPHIDGAPPNPSASNDASFAFSDSELDASFVCALDSDGFSTCASPKTYSGLGDGSHTFQVEARDAAGNRSEPTAHTWMIDAPPLVTIGAPVGGARTADTTPSFAGTAGTAPGDSSLVRVELYAGSAVSGTPVQVLETFRDAGGTWQVEATAPLTEGEYTARAEQSDAASVGRSAPRTFVVDTTPPALSLTAPADGSSTADATPAFAGAAGAAAGDSATVTVDVYAGPVASGTPVQSPAATRTGVTWAVDATSALAPGVYTARARQSDTAGNTGTSGTSTFTRVEASATYRDEVLADAPRSYWRFGETSGTVAADQRGLNPGSYAGGVTLGQPGVLVDDPDPAALFDGVNDYVLAPDSNSLDLTGAMTLEAWMKRSKGGVWQVLFGKPGTGASKGENYALWLNTANYAVAYFGDGVGYASITTAAPLDTGWHHLVASYDNATATIYVDGTLSKSAASTVRLTANALPLNFGRANSGSTFFGGLLDEVAIYDRVLSASRVEAHYRTGRAIDLEPPVPTLAAPAHASSTTDTTPALTGAAGDGQHDSGSVTVEVYAGRDALGSPVQTLSVARQGTSYTVEAAPLAAGVYTAQAKQSDTAGNVGRSSANTFGVGVAAPPAQRVLVGAGDIASCTETGDSATGPLLDRYPDAVVATIADNVYPAGTAQQYADCYEPTWGRAKSRTRPSLATHDYGDVQGGSAAGYLSYFQAQLALFGPTASDQTKGWYSYDLGQWHVIVLNSACYYYAPGCSEAAQDEWLQADLASRPADCTLAYFHNPLFTSGSVHAPDAKMRRYWDALYAAGADLILNGHNHVYERFAPQTPSGVLDTQYGIRALVVGTGGAGHYGFGTIQPNSEVRNADTYGIAKITLSPGGYQWEFVPEIGKVFTDAGSGTCHGPPPASE